MRHYTSTWQTLETKARFIAQVMTGDTTIRRIEDLDGAALTHAEVKAIASGNPLVIEKAQVDAELMRLTRLRSAHADEQFRIRRNLRHARDEVVAGTTRLSNLHNDLTQRENTAGDSFRIELNGQIVTQRGIAGEIILREAQKFRAANIDEARIGRFAGFDLYLRATFGRDSDLVLRGHNHYTANVTDTALGTIRSLESTVQGLEERCVKWTAAVTDAQKRAKELENSNPASAPSSNTKTASKTWLNAKARSKNNST